MRHRVVGRSLSAPSIVDPGESSKGPCPWRWPGGYGDASIGFFPKDETAGARALYVGGEKGIAGRFVGQRGLGAPSLDGARLAATRVPDPVRLKLDVLTYCEELTLAGNSDWRLPSANELLSIVDDRRSGPAIDLEAVPETPSDVFWSSMPSIASAEKTVLVNFTNGASQDHTVGDRRPVRCVRSDASPEL
ncbi:DUF1566 domain-containing protein [Sorangium sp. So ce1128]